MGIYKTFAEYLEQRDILHPSTDPSRMIGGDDKIMPTGCDLPETNAAGNPHHIPQQPMFRGLFKVVNPARPVFPTKSRVLEMTRFCSGRPWLSGSSSSKTPSISTTRLPIPTKPR